MIDGQKYTPGMKLPKEWYSISASKPGYESYEGRIRVREGMSAKKITLDRSTYGLTIDTVPSNANVRILNIGPSYQDGIQLKPGDYHIEVSAKGYETKKEWVTLKSQALNHRIKLTKEILNYPVKVSVLPTDAQVRVNNQPYQNDLKLPEGNYLLEASKQGYKSFEGQINVRPSMPTKQINLNPLTYGLTINTTPRNAQVQILGIKSKYHDGIKLAPKEYTLQVSAPGYITKKEKINIKDKALVKNVKLDQDVLTQLGIELAAIPAGSFMMGSNNGDDDEKPVHRVSVPAFKMMTHEVTWAQYQPCIDAGVCSTGSDGDEGWGKGNRPVINVSWNDAQDYIRWLNQQTGMNFRLPSEAEWEYAARANTTTAFSTGDRISTSQANFDGNYTHNGSSKGQYREKTLPVGSFQPNDFGLYDMHGNVWEWTQDCWNGSYSGAPNNGAAWESGNCGKRVLRGGSWYSLPINLRSASRFRHSASSRYDDNGFRLVQGQ
jgi:formylglycine-generating enzyme required for sulfatase activity